jgi:hypothetical protein
MTYRGIENNGVVVHEGEKPLDGTVVGVTALDQSLPHEVNLPDHPAIGIWKDRTDLPDDAVQASKVLRQRLMRRADE